MNLTDYIQLYPCCKIVKGKDKDAIYDLQREDYYLIPHSLTRILEESSDIPWQQLKKRYKDEGNTLQSYLDLLLNKELAILGAKIDGFKELDTSFNTYSEITNAILDFNESTSYNLSDIIKELDGLRCEFIELRYYSPIAPQKLEDTLLKFDHSSFRGVEILVPYDPCYEIEYIIKLSTKFPRLRKITFHGSPDDIESIMLHEEICIIYTSELITDESHCGVVNQWYMLPKTELYIESQSYNTCLNRKLGFDKNGIIKNCPSFGNGYGKAGKVPLREIVNDKTFRKVWTIRKDDIEGCKDCELRHMCQDCRAYTTDRNNPYSKPKKCHYIQKQ